MAEFNRIERKFNPITGRPDEKASSDKMRNLWIQLHMLMI